MAGLVVHLLLTTFSKDDSDPPVCYSLIGYVVPCGNVSSAAASVSACVVAGVLLGGAGDRRSRRADRSGR
jgi:hypothetical protein